ncbi:response regulator transcription factor [Isoptericola sp. b490]|uniref:response regulator transcription factor n=1 Tax=Actinotalea lenta TaxID=3064654 RepID=UPI002712362F|nr:response regulator transcription factor [Isoptericola sp. b490]MDO8119846.1 response regulator transcription factor [Isoptericola sp. b490]
MSRGFRVGVVDDHPAIAAGVPVGLRDHLPLDGECPVASTVRGLLETARDLDVVLLDIRLQDRSAPADNVRRLVARGWPVLLFTQVRQPAVVAACLQAGAAGVVGKHEGWTTLAAAVRTVAGGEDHVNADWAAALRVLVEGRAPALAPREAQVVNLYSTGLPMKSVARRLGVGEETAKEYLARVKRKYLEAGRPVHTRSELYLRALEDGLLDPPGGV